MKQAFYVLIAILAFAGGAQAREIYVPGRYLANGTYVPPHYRQVPDGPIYPGYQNVDPEANVAPVPYPNGVPFAPYQGAPYQAAPYAPAPGYVPNYGYIPR